MHTQKNCMFCFQMQVEVIIYIQFRTDIDAINAVDLF